MARKRDPRRDEAFEIYKKHNGEITNRKIAEMLDVPEKTIGSWKSKAKDCWDEKLNGVLQKEKRSTPKEKNTANVDESTEVSSNRSGNPNPKNQFSHRNNPNWLHGLRSKYLHDEQIEIIEAFQDCEVADKLWIQLEIKFSAIIRMQKVMWVNDEKDTLSDISMRSDGDDGSMTGYKVAYAYERYEAYIRAQARAMAEYRNLADSFLKHASLDDERRLKLEQMQQSINKTKAEIDKLGSDEQSGPIEIKIVGKKRK